MLENIYLKLGIAAAILAAVVGSIVYVNHLWGVIDDKKTEITVLKTQIETMKASQRNQTKVSEDNVTKVIQIPVTTREIIKEVDKAIDAAPSCVAPDYPQDVKDAF